MRYAKLNYTILGIKVMGPSADTIKFVHDLCQFQVCFLGVCGLETRSFPLF